MNINKLRIKTIHIIPLSFLLVILSGAVLLMLPISSATHTATGFVDALFTATTSVCVTGLVVVDTYAKWSFFGQIIILILIQVGGLGVVTVGAMVMNLTKMKFSLGQRVLLEDSLNVDRKREVRSFLRRIIKDVFIVEGIGAALYAIEFIPMLGVGRGIWASVFQSISAFCNAGMDVVGPNSMIDFNDSSLLMCVTMVLIVLGGLGFVVWADVVEGIRSGIRRRMSFRTIIRHLSEHSKLVLLLTAFLIVAGAIVIFIAEYNNPLTMGKMSFGSKVLNSFFQSVTLRTAGFASVPQESLTDISCVVGCILMFIGGSPVGTAGGVKTVTIFIVLMNVISYVRGKKENVIFHRRISDEKMRKAAAIVFVNALIAVVMIILLLTRSGVVLTDAAYEVLSALGTVGVSRNLTPNLDTIGRIIIIITMYLGRIGPISMAIFFTKGDEGGKKIRHGEGNFYVG